jgi:diguanylate cyclase (GGDEF)-like protein
VFTRKSDTIIRLGGDEFLIICAGADKAGTLKLMALIKDASPIPLSLGSASATEKTSSLKDLIKIADAAMYADKNNKKAGRK